MLENLLDYLKSFFFWALTPIFEAIKFIAFFFFDQFCNLLVFAFSLFSVPGELVLGAFVWSDLPGPMLYLLNAVGIPQCINILTAAVTFRLLLNLMPSWLTRV